MLLSELLQKKDAPSSVFGVEIDVESFVPPPGLKEIGVVFKGANGEFDETVLDIVISYAIADVSVILEVSFESDPIDLPYLLATARNAGFSVSLLPPVEHTLDNMRAYGERLSELMLTLLDQKQFSGQAFPATSFLEYLFVESWGANTEHMKSPDTYIKDCFSSKIHPEDESRIKDSMRTAVYKHFGDKSTFDSFAKLTLKSLSDEYKNQVIKMQASVLNA